MHRMFIFSVQGIKDASEQVRAVRKRIRFQVLHIHVDRWSRHTGPLCFWLAIGVTMMPYYPELGSEQRRRPHEGEEQDAGYTRFEGAKNRFAGGRFRAAKRIQKGRSICRLHGSIHACAAPFQGYVGLLRTADSATPQAFRPWFGRDDQRANGRAVKTVYLSLAYLRIAGRMYPVAWRTS